MPTVTSKTIRSKVEVDTGGAPHIHVVPEGGAGGWLSPEKPDLFPYIFSMGLFALATGKQLRATYKDYDGSFYKGVTKVEVV